MNIWIEIICFISTCIALHLIVKHEQFSCSSMETWGYVLLKVSLPRNPQKQFDDDITADPELAENIIFISIFFGLSFGKQETPSTYFHELMMI